MAALQGFLWENFENIVIMCRCIIKMPTSEMYMKSIKITHLRSKTLENSLRSAKNEGTLVLLGAPSQRHVCQLKLLLQPLQVLFHQLPTFTNCPRLFELLED